VGWFDVVLILPLLGIIWLASRQEAGLALLAAVATLAAARLAIVLAPSVGYSLGMVKEPYAVSPLARLILFLLLWALGLLVAWLVHGQTRWSLEVLDPLAGVALGFMIALTAGHIIVSAGFQIAQTAQHELPAYISNSRAADELRNFRSYVYLLDTFERYQRGGA